MPSVSVPTAAITGLLTSAGIGTAAGAGATAGLLGADATLGLATGLTTGLEGAALGAGTSWATGGNPLVGAGIGFGTAGLTGGLGAGLAGAPAGAVAADATTVPTTAAAGAPAATAAAPATVGGASAASVPAASGSFAAPLDPTATGVVNALGGTTPETVTVTAPTAAGGAAAPAAVAAPGIGGAAGGAVAGATQPAVAANQPSSVDKFVNDPSLAGFGNILKSNPQAVLGALGLGYDVMNQGSVPGMGQLQNFATQEQKMAQANQSYVNTGTLPAGAQAALDQATNAAKAQVRSKYASLGMSGSTAETQDLANVDVSAAGEKFSIASQLLQAGASQANVSQEMLNEILGINQKQEADTTAAISAFAASLGGGGTPLYLTQTPGR